MVERGIQRHAMAVGDSADKVGINGGASCGIKFSHRSVVAYEDVIPVVKKQTKGRGTRVVNEELINGRTGRGIVFAHAADVGIKAGVGHEKVVVAIQGDLPGGRVG